MRKNVLFTSAPTARAPSTRPGGSGSPCDGLEQFIDRIDDLRSMRLERERQHAVRGKANLRIGVDELQQFVGVDFRFFRELYHTERALTYDRDDAKLLRESLYSNEVQQILHVHRQRAEAVAHLVSDRLEPLISRRRSDFFVEHHSHVLVADVIVRDVDVDAEIHGRLHFLFDDLALQLANCLFEQPCEHLEADGGDLSRLLAAEDVAGSANFEVLGRNPESRAKVGELLNGGETLSSVARQDFVAGNE